MLKNLFALLLLLALLTISSFAGNICYFPNGSTSSDVPCDANAAVTQCCGTRSACLSNGLCALGSTSSNSGISYARGTCTDKSWASPSCPQQCQLNQDTPTNKSAYDFRADGVQIWECGGAQGYAKEAQYCCESMAEGTRCCSTETAVFTLAAASIGPSELASTSSSEVPQISTTRSASSALMTRVVPLPVSSTSRFESVSPSPSTTAPPAQRSDNNATRIGAGVGGALGGCLLIAAIVLLIRWHKRRKDANSNLNNGTFKKYSVPGLMEMDPGAQRHEMPGLQPHELATRGMAAEMPAHGVVWELPAERR